ncbi:phosphoribosyl pyrophosphate transferase [Gordonia Phage Sephiroth]|uniref:Phosphoribosyl pyrophosphate transferase n=1 Tax=Gordonia Phage Sephiroth TaxID=2767553 RepID=A0A7G9UZH4_9CAUD|nr:ribose-phosphate pyrophosphokinase [Gordonia Phage Sephiroth]QNN99429.1 phosphoribosyl pyrophosphate transferase [Gordonia Phage Sephiroth]
MTVHLWAQSLDDKELHSIRPFQFPGGEWHITLGELFDQGRDYQWIANVQGASAEDLVVATLLADIAMDRGEDSTLLIPYLPAARADRGVPLGLSVYGGIINAACFTEVVTLDAHNPKAAVREVSGLVNLSPTPLVTATIQYHDTFTGVIAPDAGARQRAADVAKALGVPLVVADKQRDFDTGQITGLTVPDLDRLGNYLVVDDICDGGGTFMALARATGLPQSRLSLWVTHGIFSGRASDLLDRYYKAVYTTDSHPGSGQLGMYTVKTPTWAYMFRKVQA